MGVVTAAAAAPEPRLRDPRARDRRGRRDADAGPRDDAHHDGAAGRPLRAQHRRSRGSSSAAPSGARERDVRTSDDDPDDGTILTAMLFDLRGRGRRRTVQAIYLSLAILMGGGLVLFGIGGATSGGLFDAIKGNSELDERQRHVQEARRRAREARPGQPERLARLGPARRCPLPGAGTGANYDQTTRAFTAKGKAALRRRRPRGSATSRSAREARRDASRTRWSRRTARRAAQQPGGGQGARDRDRRDAEGDVPDVRPARRARLRGRADAQGDLAAEKAASSRRRTRRSRSATSSRRPKQQLDGPARRAQPTGPVVRYRAIIPVASPL